MTPISPVETLAAVLLAAALLHTFAARAFERLAHRYPRHAGLFHLLGETEVVFGIWAIVLVLCIALLAGPAQAIEYAESRRYTEPLFVFVVMVIAASAPVLDGARRAIESLARALPVDRGMGTTWLCLAALPLLGSLLTEPAAMTLAALALRDRVFRPETPKPPKYFALGVLFVNVSIGGTLTSYAAPPVLMVAATWSWDSAFMLATFGWRAVFAVMVNATLATWLLRQHVGSAGSEADRARVPPAVLVVHLLFLAAVVLMAHHPVLFVAVFLLFLGFTKAYGQGEALILREALLVAFFLAGLVVLGGMQEWWLAPLVAGMDASALFFGALALTAITDNAALTYLGSLIEGIPAASQYALVAGAVAGGGLTVIANAPNPAGVALLRSGFPDESIGAGGLLLGALLPTAVAAIAFLV